jgi:hypothetical protein
MVRWSIQPAVFALVARSCIAAQLVTRNALPSDALSDNCVNALVADVSCAPGVVGFGSGAHYTTEALEESCTSACRNALGDYQASAAAACTKSDVFQITESRTAPASFIPTLLYYQFNKTCIQDDGRWCQDVLYEISGGNATNITTRMSSPLLPPDSH